MEQFIRFSALKLSLPLIPLAVLVGISMAWDFEPWRMASPWVHATFGGIVVLLAAGCLFLPRAYYLRLGADGLTIANLTGTQHYRWSEVRGFRVAGTIGNGMAVVNRVVFDLGEGSPHRTTAVKAARLVTGHDGSFAAIYTVSAEDLAVLLNDWQRRFGTIDVPAGRDDPEAY